ncbi:ER protein Pkr1-domain-containing protein [Tuber brumale]|nr:ER protein Pkr1-domain-containing protein [Tuber brumale]
MATFATGLWNSIFTPGTNSSLVLATHASFFALQITFLALLAGTHSYHFIILSFICAGLWMGITWFIREIDILKKEQEEVKERLGVERRRKFPD